MLPFVIFAFSCQTDPISQFNRNIITVPDTTSTSDEEGSVAATVSSSNGGKLTASGSTDEEIKDTEVVIPPGALAVDTNVSIKQATPVLTPQVSQELGLDSSAKTAGPSVAIEADDMNALQGTLAVSLPYTATEGAALASFRYAVIGIYSVGGKFRVETFVGSEISIGKKKVTVNIRRFGAYQVIRAAVEIKKKAAASSSGYVDKSTAKKAGIGSSNLFYIANTTGQNDGHPKRKGSVMFLLAKLLGHKANNGLKIDAFVKKCCQFNFLPIG